MTPNWRCGRRLRIDVHTYDEELRLFLQDDGFLDQERWDFENTPPRTTLLLHYHPLVLYRHQVIKQADVVLATFLLGDAFSYEDKRRILDYYDPYHQ